MEMKRTLVSLLSLTALFSLLTLTSCQKEQMGNGRQFRATMEGCTGQNDKTVLDGTALNWVEGDQIVVYGNAGSGLYTATPQTPATVALFDNVSGETGDGPFRAYYPSTLTTDGVNITLPAAQTYVAGSINEFPMYAESGNNQLAFKNLCGVLKLHLTKANTSISTIAVTANTEINGAFSIDFTNGIPETDYVSDGTNTTLLTCATAQAIDNGADFYIYLPADSYTGLQIEMNTDDGKYCVKTANTTINVVRSQYTLVSLGENDLDFVEPLPEGALPGLFSVSATQQVRFSQGNLQYQASTDTWRFAEHQYDYVGGTFYVSNFFEDIPYTVGNVYENGIQCNNLNIGPNYSGWMDLFGWGTGNNPTLASSEDNRYNTFFDWGINSISNGGNRPNTWRTLTIYEWEYLFFTRTDAFSKNAPGNVNGVPGIIILPDNWTLPTGCSFTYDSYGYGNVWYADNTYSLSQWAEMEAAGAVFLPAAGYLYRDNGTGYNWGNMQVDIQYYPWSGHVADGEYWSSSILQNSTDGSCNLKFICNGIEHADYHDGTNKCNGNSVRLVQNNN